MAGAGEGGEVACGHAYYCWERDLVPFAGRKAGGAQAVPTGIAQQVPEFRAGGTGVRSAGYLALGRVLAKVGKNRRQRRGAAG